ncbi:MAG: histone deacetylase [Myxococcota bacterium]
MGLRELLSRGRRRPLRLYYDEAYRLPVTGGVDAHQELRRADDAAHYLVHAKAVRPEDVITPQPVSYEALARAHTAAYLESLHEAETLAQIFAAEPSELFVDEVLRSLRIACGGTLAAARHVLEHGGAALNLMGGFHHAAPSRGAGFCALNDVAVALAQLRHDGFGGKAAVIDLDFHPPDGTAECLGKDPTVWLGSISGADWGPLPGVDEVELPEGTDDATYLAALDALLSRIPEVRLAFVLAGGDVLNGDRLGRFRLTLPGVRRRDLQVALRLGSVPQVWLPAGGYSSNAWKVLAGSGLVLAFHSEEPIPVDYDPLAARMTGIARSLKPESLGSDLTLSDADLAEALGMARGGPRKFMQFYTAEGIEYALERYRILPVLRRLGFDQLHVVIDTVGPYDRARLVGRDKANGQPATLVDLEVERKQLADGVYLFVNWLTLRNPRAHFSALRPQLPGQEVPGLGLAREFSNLLGLMAQRLMLDGVAFRPSWYHMAWAARHNARFVAPERQGRFEALMRDLASMNLLDATRAVAEGRVLLNGQPYTWEPDEMVSRTHPHEDEADRAAIVAERDRCRFTVLPAGARATQGKAG